MMTVSFRLLVPPLAAPAGTLAEQYGQFYGDMFSDLVDIIKGQDEGTIAETVGKLAALTFCATGIGYGTIVGTLPLAFGVDGWEFVKGLAADALGAFEDAVDAVAGVAEDVWDWLF
jgi:hypothetical protein